MKTRGRVVPLRAMPIVSSALGAVVGGGVGAGAAVDVDRDRPGRSRRRRSIVSAPPSVRDVDVVERRLAAGHATRSARPATTDVCPRRSRRRRRRRRRCRWRRRCRPRRRRSPSKALRSTLAVSRSVPAEVVDGDGVGAAERADVRRLDAVEVHRDAGDVADQAHARAVGRDVDLLADVGAVEVQRVAAALALDGVAAVARIPLEGVVAGAQLGGVGADVAVDEVVAGAAEQRVGAVAAARACRRRRRRRASGGSASPMPFWPMIVSAPPRPLDDELLDRGVVDRAARPGVTNAATAVPLRAMPMVSSASVPCRWWCRRRRRRRR